MKVLGLSKCMCVGGGVTNIFSSICGGGFEKNSGET